jgi:cyanophycinase
MEGLGLWSAAVVSPHFTERRRSGPLVEILRVHPKRVGVGIDEGTAIFISSGRLEVAGSGTVTILDSPDAPVRILKSGGRLVLSVDGFPRR